MAIRSSSNTCISCCNLSHFVAFALSALSALSRSSWSAQLEAKSQKWPRLTNPWMFKKHAKKKRPKIYRISVKTHRNPSNFRLRIHPKNPSKPIKIPVSWYDQAFGALSCCWIWHMVPDYISNHMAGWDIPYKFNSNEKSTTNHVILHCHVWLPEGTIVLKEGAAIQRGQPNQHLAVELNHLVMTELPPKDVVNPWTPHVTETAAGVWSFQNNVNHSMQVLNLVCTALYIELQSFPTRPYCSQNTCWMKEWIRKEGFFAIGTQQALNTGRGARSNGWNRNGALPPKRASTVSR